MVCLPCQIGGHEYKGYGTNPFKNGTRDGKQLLMMNDWKNALKNAGEGLPAYLTFDDYSTGNLHEIYNDAMPLGEYLKTFNPSAKNKLNGQILLMNFQKQCKNSKHYGEQRFYVAEFPFTDFGGASFDVQPENKLMPLCGFKTSWGVPVGLEPCHIKIKKGETISFSSSALSRENVPYNAVWVIPEGQAKGYNGRRNTALKF